MRGAPVVRLVQPDRLRDSTTRAAGHVTGDWPMRRWYRESMVAAAFVAVLLALGIVRLVGYRNSNQLSRINAQVAHRHVIIDELQNTLSAVQDAEAAQRGFLLTG